VAYVAGQRDGTVAETGDLRIVTLAGRRRTVVPAKGVYGGQIIAVTWARVARGIRFRRPQPTDGIFAGGNVVRLAADGPRVAYASCLNVFSWLPPTGSRTQHFGDDRCVGAASFREVYDLAVSADRVAWGWKLGVQEPFAWSLLTSDAAAAAQPYALAAGRGFYDPEQSLGGSLQGSGGALVFAQWTSTDDATTATVYRAPAAGCPCPVLARATAARGIAPLVALDTDGTHVALLRGESSVEVVDVAGAPVLSLPVAAAGAQLMAGELVVLAGGRLSVHDVATGVERAIWILPSAATTAGRDCTRFSEPRCPFVDEPAELRLEDAAHGLAAYLFREEVHVLRLADGRDTAVGFGSAARFTDGGLVFADGARVRFIPYGRLR
jgi:hypothetical protein